MPGTSTRLGQVGLDPEEKEIPASRSPDKAWTGVLGAFKAAWKGCLLGVLREDFLDLVNYSTETTSWLLGAGGTASNFCPAMASGDVP